ncbi:hypothetical protein B0A48_00118 [Cryoendolithus antarcticus]|uniref:Enoyl reductase (ER) domain-containing protein n=1 Tax=Cryoendolithus antarcticus TaxID=1507870 RepID=A0A1V8TTQ6_9PEZI|nr:hypothetical protein B0A48_00118 [Cryoendolithus antarcticus]
MANDNTMEALRANKSENGKVTLVVEDVPILKSAGGEVLVKIRASAVQPSDVLNSKGLFATTTYPRTIGRGWSGTVTAGPDDWIGKDVFGTSGISISFTHDGAQATYAVLPVNALTMKPSSLSHEQAALLGTPFATAMIILARATAKPGENVLVLGAMGNVGSWVMQAARAMGCKAIGVGRHGTNISSTTDPTLSAAKALTGGKGLDVAVDTIGDFALTKAAFDILAPNGRLCTITAPRSGGTELPLDILSLYSRQISVVGCNSIGFNSQEDLAGMLREKLVPWLDEGKLTVPDLGSTERLPIERAVQAYDGRVKKAVIVFDE